MAFAKGRTDFETARRLACGSVRQTSLDEAQKIVSGRNTAYVVNSIAAACFASLLSAGAYAGWPHLTARLRSGEEVRAVHRMIAQSEPGTYAFDRLGGGVAMMGKAGGKKSCADYSAREIVEAEARTVRRLRAVEKDKSGMTSLGFILPSSMADMGAMTCNTAFGAMYGGKATHESGREMTDAERRMHAAKRSRELRKLRRQMGLKR